MKNLRLRVSENLRKLRLKCGITQEKLAETAHIDYKYLQRLEGKTPPALKVDTIGKLAKALKVRPEGLLK